MMRANILLYLLERLDVPKERMDTSKQENLLWLQRNLAINNGAAPETEKALMLIREKLKQF